MAAIGKPFLTQFLVSGPARAEQIWGCRVRVPALVGLPALLWGSQICSPRAGPETENVVRDGFLAATTPGDLVDVLPHWG